MKILFLSLAIFSTFCATAQRKSANSKNNTKPTNTAKSAKVSQLNQQYDNATVNVVRTNEPDGNTGSGVEEKYKYIINQNASRIKEVEDKLTAKRNEYDKVDKVKNNNSINTDTQKARFDMLSEFLGKDVTEYYLKQNKNN